MEKRYTDEPDLDWKYVSYYHEDSEKCFNFDVTGKFWQAYFNGPGLTSRPATVAEVRQWFKRWSNVK